MSSLKDLKLCTHNYLLKNKDTHLTSNCAQAQNELQTYWSVIDQESFNSVPKAQQRQVHPNSWIESQTSIFNQNQQNRGSFVDKLQKNGAKSSRQQILERQNSRIRQLSQSNRIDSKQRIRSQQTYFRYRIKMVTLLRRFNTKKQQIQKIQQLQAQQFIRIFINKITGYYKQLENQVVQYKKRYTAVCQSLKYKNEELLNIKNKYIQKQKQILNNCFTLNSQLKRSQGMIFQKSKQLDQLKIKLNKIESQESLKEQLEKQNQKNILILNQKEKCQFGKKTKQTQIKMQKQKQRFTQGQVCTNKPTQIKRQQKSLKSGEQVRIQNNKLIQTQKQVQEIQRIHKQKIEQQQILNLRNLETLATQLKNKTSQLEILNFKNSQISQKCRQYQQTIYKLIVKLEEFKNRTILEFEGENPQVCNKLGKIDSLQRQKKQDIQLDKKIKSTLTWPIRKFQQSVSLQNKGTRTYGFYGNTENYKSNFKMNGHMNDTMTKSANINSNCSNNNNRYQNVISKIQNGSIINSYIINNNSENPNSNTKASNSNTVSTAKKNSNINSAGKTGSSDVHRMMENLRIENKGVGNISKQEMIQRIIKMIQEWKNQMYTTVNQYEEMIEHYNEAIHKKNQEISSLRQIADKYVNTNNPQLYF